MMKQTRIIVVEDEAVVGMHIAGSLTGMGHEVCAVADSGEEAIAAARKHNPDLILMDILLKGGMDGIDAAKIIRDELEIPVVYLTGNADIATVERARLTDPYGYVLKPVNMLDLFSTIDTALHRRGLERRISETTAEADRFFRLALGLLSITDNEGRFRRLNPSWEATLGYRVEDLLGTKFTDLVHPDDYDAAMARAAELAAGNEVVDFTYRFRCRDGSYRWIEWRSSPYRGELIYAAARDVTERITAVEALRESEMRYHALFDQSPVGVLRFDTEGIVTDCNERLVSIMRSRRENLMGLNLYHLREEAVKPALHKTLAGEVSFYEGPYRVTTSDHSLWMQMVLSPLRDRDGKVEGGMGVIEDITDRKVAEEKLRLSEERNRLLIENAGEGIAVIQDERFVYTNPSLQEMTGYGADDLASRPFTDFIHADDREMIMDRYRRRLRSENVPGSYEVRLAHRGGEVRWVELNSVLFQWEGKPASLAFMRNITERKAAEEERRAMEAQIQQTQKLESLGVLAGGIAHDFNNLLMAILGNIDLALLEIPPEAVARGNLIEAAKASQRAADLCRQMLAYSGRGRFATESLNVNDLIEDMTHILEVSVSKKALLRCNFAHGLPAVKGDPTQLRQIVMNLVINASDAIGETSGAISISTGAMECDRAYLASSWLDENLPAGLYVYIEVVDTGAGMEPETLPRIFDPFFTTKFTGRGLGLAAVLGIVRGHRGAIRVTSRVGEGTAFRILLPAMARPAERQGEDGDGAPSWRGSGTVLLVDDEETIRSLGRKMLERLGFAVLVASDGREAVEMFRARHGEITFVVLDLTMPHMDGEETFEELRRVRGDVRVIMTSGYSEHEIARRFAGKGIAGFIQKPYQMKDLSSRLRKILD